MASSEAIQFLTWLRQEGKEGICLQQGSAWLDWATSEGYAGAEIRSEFNSFEQALQLPTRFEDLISSPGTDPAELIAWINELFSAIQTDADYLLAIGGGTTVYSANTSNNSSAHSFDRRIKHHVDNELKELWQENGTVIHPKSSTTSPTSNRTFAPNFDPTQDTYKYDGRRFDGSLTAKTINSKNSQETQYSYSGKKINVTLTATDWKLTGTPGQHSQTVSGSFTNKKGTQGSVSISYTQKSLNNDAVTLTTTSNTTNKSTPVTSGNTTTSASTTTTTTTTKEYTDKELQITTSTDQSTTTKTSVETTKSNGSSSYSNSTQTSNTTTSSSVTNGYQDIALTKDKHAYSSLLLDISKIKNKAQNLGQRLQTAIDVHSVRSNQAISDLKDNQKIKLNLSKKLDTATDAIVELKSIDLKTLTNRQIDNIFYVGKTLDRKVHANKFKHRREERTIKEYFDIKSQEKLNQLNAKLDNQIETKEVSIIDKKLEQRTNKQLPAIFKSLFSDWKKYGNKSIYNEPGIGRDAPATKILVLTYNGPNFSAQFKYDESWNSEYHTNYSEEASLSWNKNGKSNNISLAYDGFAQHVELDNASGKKIDNKSFKSHRATAREKRKDKLTSDYKSATSLLGQTIKFIQNDPILKLYTENSKYSNDISIISKHKLDYLTVNAFVEQIDHIKYAKLPIKTRLDIRIDEAIFLRTFRPLISNFDTNHKQQLKKLGHIRDIFKYGSHKGSDHFSTVAAIRGLRNKQTNQSQHHQKITEKMGAWSYNMKISKLLSFDVHKEEFFYNIEKFALKNAFNVFEKSLASGDTVKQSKKIADQTYMQDLLKEDKFLYAMAENTYRINAEQDYKFNIALEKLTADDMAHFRITKITPAHLIPKFIPAELIAYELKTTNKMLQYQQKKFGSIKRMELYYRRMTYENNLIKYYNKKQVTWSSNHLDPVYHGFFYKLGHGIKDFFKDSAKAYWDLCHLRFKKAIGQEDKIVKGAVHGLEYVVGGIEHIVDKVGRDLERWIINPLFSWVPGGHFVEKIFNKTGMAVQHIGNIIAKGLLRMPRNIIKDFDKLGHQFGKLFTGNATWEGVGDAIKRDTKGPRSMVHRIGKLAFNMETFHDKRVFQNTKNKISDISKLTSAFAEKDYIEYTLKSERKVVAYRKLLHRNTFGLIESPSQKFIQRHSSLITELQGDKFKSKHPSIAKLENYPKEFPKWMGNQIAMLQKQFKALSHEKQINLINALMSGTLSPKQKVDAKLYLREDFHKEYNNINVKTIQTIIAARKKDFKHYQKSVGEINLISYFIPPVEQWAKVTTQRNIRRTKLLINHPEAALDISIATKYSSVIYGEQQKINKDWLSWGKADAKKVKNVLEVSMLPQVKIFHNPFGITVLNGTKRLGGTGRTKLNTYFSNNNTGKRLFDKLMWALFLIRVGKKDDISSFSFISPTSQAWLNIKKRQDVFVNKYQSSSWLSRYKHKAKVLNRLAVEEYYVDFILTRPVSELIDFRHYDVKLFMNRTFSSITLTSIQEILRYDQSTYAAWKAFAKKNNTIFVSDYSLDRANQKQNHNLTLADVVRSFAPPSTQEKEHKYSLGQPSKKVQKKARKVNLLMVYHQVHMLKHLLKGHKEKDKEAIEADKNKNKQMDQVEKDAETKVDKVVDDELKADEETIIADSAGEVELEAESDIDIFADDLLASVELDMEVEIASVSEEIEADAIDALLL